MPEPVIPNRSLQVSEQDAGEPRNVDDDDDDENSNERAANSGNHDSVPPDHSPI